MVRISCIFLVLLVFTTGHLAVAQESSDTVDQRGLSLNEALIIKDQQQQRIDSLVKIQLQQELVSAEGNEQKTRELEAKLLQIAQGDSLRRVNQLHQIQSLKQNAKGYPVHLNNDTLFMIFTRTGSFNAQDRATAISGKIEKLYDDPFYSADSLKINDNGDSFDLVYKKTNVILTVANLDGLWFGKSNAELASEYLSKIKSGISQQRTAHSLVNWLKRIGLVLLITVFLVIMVKLINRLFRKTAALISAGKIKILSMLHLQKVRFITAEHLENALLKLNFAFRIIVILLMVYLSLPLVFSIFPETEQWTGTLLGWILEPLRSALLAIMDYLPYLFRILVICLIFRYLLKGIRYLFDEIKQGNIHLRGFHRDWAIPTFNILRFILYAFMLVLIFPYLPGSDSPAFKGVSVFLGILFSLGSSSAITNIVAGLVITYMRPFRLGDRVKIGDVVGDVMEKTMLVTRIKTIKNEDITVPNSMILSSSTVNYSSHTKNDRQGLIIHLTVSIGYDAPWKKVYDLLIAAALKTPHLQQEPQPFVLQTSLDDFYISYQINAYTLQANKQAGIYSALMENIQDEFKAAGVEILSPGYHVIRDGGKE